MRIIARLDIKNDYVIKGIHLEGLRKVGDPNELARKYYTEGIDELVLIDTVASLYGRNNIFSVIRKASEDIFVPITVGGGLRTLDDIKCALDSGADKVAINSAAVRDLRLIETVASSYGSQCMVVSVQAKRLNDRWEAFIDSGREKTGLDVLEWVCRVQELGAGEILLTSVDREGTKSGFDVSLVSAVNTVATVPLIVSGGYGKSTHLRDLLSVTQPSALCFASVLHYNIASVAELKQDCEDTLEAIRNG